jgi:hypothetical protein
VHAGLNYRIGDFQQIERRTHQERYVKVWHDVSSVGYRTVGSFVSVDVYTRMSDNVTSHRAPATATEYHVTEVDPSRDRRWLRFVSAHPDGLVYHHPGWLKALQAEYSQQSLHLACEDAEGNFLAILPLHYTRGLPFNLGGALTNRRLSSLPRTPLAGPLSIDRRAAQEVLREAVTRIQSVSGLSLQLKVQNPELDGLSEGLVSTPWRLSYVLRLPSSGQPFRIPDSRDRGAVKRALNKALRLGVQVRPAENEKDLLTWYTLYLETMRFNAVPPRPYRFFRALWHELRPLSVMELLMAEYPTVSGKRIVAGSVFLKFGSTVSYAFNGSRRADLSLRPNDLILWQAINEAARSGFQYLDLGEVPDDSTDLARFKSKWGAMAVRLHRYYYPPQNDAVGGLGLKRHLVSTLETLWRSVPLSVTAWLADKLYSYL